MGIDIYLNGYEAYKSRCEANGSRRAFDLACARRDALPRGSEAAAKMQEEVEKASDAMWSGDVGYLRSSYNGGGLFRVLEEIYGFDIGGWLFPGDWEQEVPIDGNEFVRKINLLRDTAVKAIRAERFDLPLLDIFTELSGETVPDAHPQRTRSELFGDSVFKMISAAGWPGDQIQGGPVAPRARLEKDRHGWYLTEGMKDLHDFGKLAMDLKAKGERTFAYISF